MERTGLWLAGAMGCAQVQVHRLVRLGISGTSLLSSRFRCVCRRLPKPNQEGRDTESESEREKEAIMVRNATVAYLSVI